MIPFQSKKVHPCFLILSLVTPVVAESDKITMKDFLSWSPSFTVQCVLFVNSVFNIIKFLMELRDEKKVEKQKKAEQAEMANNISLQILDKVEPPLKKLQKQSDAQQKLIEGFHLLHTETLQNYTVLNTSVEKLSRQIQTLSEK